MNCQGASVKPACHCFDRTVERKLKMELNRQRWDPVQQFYQGIDKGMDLEEIKGQDEEGQWKNGGCDCRRSRWRH
ncbi:hypothetical protein SDJN02_13158, partial [Cucurbita argyrosperma subsp. argyrosperma]